MRTRNMSLELIRPALRREKRDRHQPPFPEADYRSRFGSGGSAPDFSEQVIDSQLPEPLQWGRVLRVENGLAENLLV